MSEKNKMSSTVNEVKDKKFVLHSVNLFDALFPGSYKGLQITQKLAPHQTFMYKACRPTFGKQCI